METWHGTARPPRPAQTALLHRAHEAESHRETAGAPLDALVGLVPRQAPDLAEAASEAADTTCAPLRDPTGVTVVAR